MGHLTRHGETIDIGYRDVERREVVSCPAQRSTRPVGYADGHSSTTKVALSTRTDPSGPTTNVVISWIRMGPSKLLKAVAMTTVPPGAALKVIASVKREPQVSCGSSRNVNVSVA